MILRDGWEVGPADESVWLECKIPFVANPAYCMCCNYSTY